MRRRQHTRVPVSQAVPATEPPPRPAAESEALAPALSDPAGLEREAALARLFELHYAPMLRLAVLLGADEPENVVAEAYHQIYRKWRRLHDDDRLELERIAQETWSLPWSGPQK